MFVDQVKAQGREIATAKAAFASSLGAECSERGWLARAAQPAFAAAVMSDDHISDEAVREVLLQRALFPAAVWGVGRRGGGALSHVGPNAVGAGTGESYAGAAAAANGCLYFLPRAAAGVLCVDPVLGTVRELGDGTAAKPRRASVLDVGGVAGTYASAVLGPDGKVYGVPAGAGRVLRIDPATNDVELIGDDYGSENPEKWGQAAVSQDGKFIFCAPHMSGRVLCIDVFAGTTSLVGVDHGDNSSGLWWGAVTVNHHIYFMPKCASYVLRFDTGDASSMVFGSNLDGGEKGADERKYLGACLAINGCIYAAPAWRKKILKIDPSKETVKEIEFTKVTDRAAIDGVTSYSAMVVGADGRLFGVPYSAQQVLVLDPRADTIGFMGPVKGCGARDSMYFGAALSTDGFLYCTPHNATKILRIDTLYVLEDAKRQSGPEDDPMLMLWRSNPWVWFLMFTHPFFSRDYLEWFMDIEADGVLGIGEKGAGKTVVSACGEDIHIPQLKDAPEWNTLKFSSGVGNVAHGLGNGMSAIGSGLKSVKGGIGNGLGNFGNMIQLSHVSEARKREVRLQAAGMIAAMPRLVATIFSSPLDKLEPLLEVPFVRTVLLHPRCMQNKTSIMNLLQGDNASQSQAFGYLSFLSSFDDQDASGAVAEAQDNLLSKVPGLMQLVVDIHDKDIRAEFLQLPLVKAIGGSVHVIRGNNMKDEGHANNWIVTRLFDRKRAAGIVDYFQSLGDEKNVRLIADELAELPSLLPSMLLLPSRLKERACELKIVQAILNAKLSERPAAVLVVYFDLFLLVFVLAVFVISMDEVQLLGDLSGGAFVGLIALLGAATYFTFREVWQMLTMRKMGLLEEYFSDTWNLIDIAASVFCFIMVLLSLCGEGVRRSEFFRIAASFTSISIWLKFLGRLSAFNKRLATFVHSLSQIIVDSKEFMVVFVVIVFMFAHVFYLLLGPLAFDDDIDAVVFTDKWESVLTSVLMSMGVFDRNWFQANEGDGTTTNLLVFYFFAFLFVVFIIMLNVLIAVVSDSYDFATTQAKTLFLVSRFELVAELDALGLTKKGLLSQAGEAFLRPLLHPLSRSLQLMPRERDGDESDVEGDEDAEEYEGRVKHMENMIRGIVETAVNEAKFEIIASTKPRVAKSTIW
jgi:hypothetical protein